MGGCRLLYFVKSKNGTKCKNFAVLLCFYANTFILLCPLNPTLVSCYLF